MRGLNFTTLLLIIIGGINWGLIGLFDFNLVSFLFGVDTIVANLVYIVVGLAALYQLYPLFAIAGVDTTSYSGREVYPSR